VVRGTFSPARAWRPAVGARLARTLGCTPTTVVLTAMNKLILLVLAAAGLYWLYAKDEERKQRPGYGQESPFMRCAKIVDYRAHEDCVRAAGIENIGREIVCDREPSNSACKGR
jgi:hypothetical protein